MQIFDYLSGTVMLSNMLIDVSDLAVKKKSPD